MRPKVLNVVQIRTLEFEVMHHIPSIIEAILYPNYCSFYKSYIMSLFQMIFKHACSRGFVTVNASFGLHV
jgi:hypothetical protein